LFRKTELKNLPKRPDIIEREKWEAEQALLPPDGKDLFYAKVK